MEKARVEQNAERGEGFPGRGARQDRGCGRGAVIWRGAHELALGMRCGSRVGGAEGAPPCHPAALGRRPGVRRLAGARRGRSWRPEVGGARITL